MRLDAQCDYGFSGGLPESEDSWDMGFDLCFIATLQVANGYIPTGVIELKAVPERNTYGTF